MAPEIARRSLAAGRFETEGKPIRGSELDSGCRWHVLRRRVSAEQSPLVGLDGEKWEWQLEV